MEYEPIKKRVNDLLIKIPVLRKLFFLLLDALILRQWYVKRAIRLCLTDAKPFRFYDAGAGFCQNSHYLLNHHPEAEILAVDLDPEKLAAFRQHAGREKRKRLKTETADLQKYIPAEEQDLIIAIDILEHIEDDLAVMKNFHKAAKPEGRLIISTPYQTKEAEFAAEHYRSGYTEEELQRKLNEAGWVSERRWYSYGFWGNIAWYISIKIPLSLIRFRPALLLLPFYYPITYPLVFLMMAADYYCWNRKGKGMVIIGRKKKEKKR